MATTRTRKQAGKARSFTLTLTQGERARAEGLASRDDRSLSSLVRLAVKEYCDRAEGVTTVQDRTQDHGRAGAWPRNPFDQHGKKV